MATIDPSTLFGVSGADIFFGPTAMDVSKSGNPIIYVSHLLGLVKGYEIVREVDSQTGELTENYTLTEVSSVSLRDIFNYNDDTSANTLDNDPNNDAEVGKRQITGLVTTTETDGTGKVFDVVYVSSSDPRIAVGEDLNLDTNSGQIHKLVIDPDTGDLVSNVAILRGLPRSEENHATNGLEIAVEPDGNTYLYIAQGGNTNEGAPSSEFAGTVDFALAGAILKVNLTELESYDIRTDENGEQFIMDLPTLDDPTRDNLELVNPGETPTTATGLVIDNLELDPNFTLDGDRTDQTGTSGASDRAGGNDGLNQAKITDYVLVQDNGQLTLVSNPLQLYAPGFRNPYDLAISEDGQIFSIDNGPNTDFGAAPLAFGTNTEVSDWTTQLATNEFNDGALRSNDQLQYIGQLGDENGTYGGSPNPIRAAVGILEATFDTDGSYLAGAGQPTIVNINGTPTQIFADETEAQAYLASILIIFEADTNGVFVDVTSDTGLPADLFDIVSGYDWIHPGTSLSDPTQFYNGSSIQDGTPFSPESQLFLSDSDGSLLNYQKATGGQAFYNASFFGGELDGVMLTTGYTDQSLNFIRISDTNNDGRPDDAEDLGDISGIGANPLAIAALGDNGFENIFIDNDNDGIDDFAGLIFVGTFGPDDLVIFTPNGQPFDAGTDLDQDGFDNTTDAFVGDPLEGKGVTLSGNNNVGTNFLEWQFEFNNPESTPAGAVPTGNSIAGDLGLNAVFRNGTTTQFDPSGADTTALLKVTDFVFGAASSFVQVLNAGEGTAIGADNDQDSVPGIGFQVDATVGTATIKTLITNYFQQASNLSTGKTWDGGERTGLVVGPGHQSDFVEASIAVYDDDNNTNTPPLFGLLLTVETGDVPVQTFIEMPGVESAASLGTNDPTIELEILFDLTAGSESVSATARYLDSGVFSSDFTTSSLSLTQPIIDALKGEALNQGKEGGAFIGLLTSVDDGDDGFSAQYAYVQIDGTESDFANAQVLYRWNGGTSDITSIDSGPDWLTTSATITGNSNTSAQDGDAQGLDAAVDTGAVPTSIFDEELSGNSPGNPLGLEFGDGTLDSGFYLVRIFAGDGFAGTSAVGSRIFDISIEDTVQFDDVDLVSLFGHEVGGVLETVVEVTDGTLDIDFLNGVQSTLVNGVEILAIDPDTDPKISVQDATVAENGGTLSVTIESDRALTEDVIVSFVVRTGSGTAIPEVDFSFPGADSFDGESNTYFGTATILGTGTSTTFDLTILDDLIPEGDETFEVEITAVSGSSAKISSFKPSAVITITDDEPVNNAPVAVDDTASTDETTVSIGNVLTNDTDTENDTLSVTEVNGVAASVGTQITLTSGALLTLNSDGSFSYDPNGAFDNLFDGQTGTDSFDYTVSDGFNTDTGTVNVSIAGSGVVTTQVLFRWNAGTSDVAAIDGGLDWTTTSATITGTSGTSTQNAAANGLDPSVDALSVPTDLYTQEVSNNSPGNPLGLEFGDGTLDPGSYLVRIFVGNGFAGTSQEGQRVFDISLEDQLTFDDVDLVAQFGHKVGGVLETVVDVTDGTLDIDFTNVTQGTLVNGVEVVALDPDTSAKISVQDASVAENGGTLSITIESDKALTEDVTVNFTVRTGSGTAIPEVDFSFPGAISFDSLTNSYTGSLVISGTATSATFDVSILDDLLPDGDETFEVEITSVSGSDAKVSNTNATATITITDDEPFNNAPVAVDDSPATDEATIATGNVLTNDTDVENDTLTITEVNGVAANVGTQITLSTGALLTLNSDGSFSYDPNGAFDGLFDGQSDADSFEYTVSDGFKSDTGTVNVSIAGLGQATTEVVLRWNAGADVTAIDGGPDWLSTSAVITGNQGTDSNFDFDENGLDPSVPNTTPVGIWDVAFTGQTPSLPLQLDLGGGTLDSGTYIVRLYAANGWPGSQTAGVRVFDVNVEGSLAFDDVDLSGTFGHRVGAVLEYTTEVTDGTVDVDFIHVANNPTVNAIELIRVIPGENADPVATDDTATTDEDTAVVGNVLTNDTDADVLDTLTVTEVNGSAANVGQAITLASGATVTLNSDGSYTYDPNSAFESLNDGDTGSDSFTYKVADGKGGVDTATVNVSIDGVTDTAGEATFSVLIDKTFVQNSTNPDDSFLITNTGGKVITQVEIDVTNALYPDTVFDPFGLAGDSNSKALSIDTEGGTGAVTPTNASYVGAGGIAGYEGIILTFDENTNGGFQPGETLGFSIDMDPNSIAGSEKATLDAGADPSWDVGGVSGAELIGATYTITFADGSTATGQLQSNGSQAGAQGIASQATPNTEVTLTVNGLGEGDVGNYTDGGPTVIVNGPAGETARVVLTKGIIQPGNNLFSEPYASQLDAQLAALAASDFPANNAAEFQVFDILLDGTDQDISNLFDFTQVPNFVLAVNEAQVPLAFTASVIDPNNGDLPLGKVNDAIYLTYTAPTNSAPVAVADSVTTDEDTAVNGNVLTNDTDVDTGDVLTVTQVNGSAANVGQAVTLTSGATVTLNSDGTFSYDPNGAFEGLNSGDTGSDSFTYTVSDGNGGTDSATVTVGIDGVTDVVETTLSLAILPASISENGGIATATITRTGDTSSELIVTLSSNDTSEATVPTTVTILAGETTATFDVTAVDDVDIDGAQVATITASAASVTTDATANVTVTDDEVSNDILIQLIDADTDLVIADLSDGSIVPLSLVDGKSLTISATVPTGSQYESTVESMVLNLNSGAFTRTESVEPYALFGDKSGTNFFGKTNIVNIGANAISFALFDGNSGSGNLLDTITVNFTVDDEVVNTPPVAVDDSITANEDNVFNGNVLTNDSDADNDPLTVTEVNGATANVGQSVALASGALVTLNSDGTFAYDPNGAFESLNVGDTGADSFTYKISDGDGGESTATVNVTIEGVNDGVNTAPTAVDDTVSTGESNVFSGNAITNDTDPDGDQLTVIELEGQAVNVGVPVEIGSGAIVTMNADGTFDYDPNGAFDALENGQTGSDSFTYTVSDGRGGTSTATVNVSIDGESVTFPTDITVSLINADTDEVIVTLGDGQTISAALIENIPLTISATVPGSSQYAGSVESMRVDLNNGSFARTESVEPYALFGDSSGGTNFFGQSGILNTGANSVSFALYTENKLGGTLLDTITLNFTVEEQGSTNNAPVALNDTATTDEDSVVNGTVLTNDSDADNDTLTVTEVNGSAANVGQSVTLASGATVTLNSDGTYAYNPNSAFEALNDGDAGADSFTYKIADGNGGESTATVNVTINGVTDVANNNPPVAQPGAATGDEDGTLTGTLSATDPDVGDTLTFALATNPSNGSAVVNSNGTFTYTPAVNFNGTDSFTYSVSDGKGGTATETVTLTVNPVNDDPVATDDSATTNEDTLVNGQVLTNDTDVENDTLSVIEVNGSAVNVGQALALASGATVTLNSDGTFAYDPNGAFESLNTGDTGSDSFTYKVSDGNGGESTATVNLTIDGVTDVAPALSLSFAQSSIAENGGSTTATVTRTGDTSSAVTVTLASGDTSEATVPATVEIAAGQTSATFTVSAVDDTLIDGTQTAAITASATGLTGTSADIDVTDNETLPTTTLTVNVASDGEEFNTSAIDSLQSGFDRDLEIGNGDEAGLLFDNIILNTSDAVIDSAQLVLTSQRAQTFGGTIDVSLSNQTNTTIPLTGTNILNNGNFVFSQNNVDPSGNSNFTDGEVFTLDVTSLVQDYYDQAGVVDDSANDLLFALTTDSGVIRIEPEEFGLGASLEITYSDGSLLSFDDEGII